MYHVQTNATHYLSLKQTLNTKRSLYKILPLNHIHTLKSQTPTTKYHPQKIKQTYQETESRSAASNSNGYISIHLNHRATY